ncbi:hypothetical protein [Mangrovicoccus ximenensis]|uniref:hypothetical protein n=1 Tax=Mangrovicoccus ximenensis TaxID=1911570 RepID=UPI00137528FF|nr:hypothetical protein [Mangrovicoccus ximenensis]
MAAENCISKPEAVALSRRLALVQDILVGGVTGLAVAGVLRRVPTHPLSAGTGPAVVISAHMVNTCLGNTRDRSGTSLGSGSAGSLSALRAAETAFGTV